MRRVVTDAPVSYSVYSAFSFYGSRRGGELPGTWLTAALGVLGHALPAIRQTLYRMERSDELVSRPVGRGKIYRLSTLALAEADAGLAKIMNTEPAPWDHQWTILRLRPGDDTSPVRDRLREILRAEGFARLGAGLFLHPRDRSAGLLRAAREYDMAAALDVFRGPRVGGETDPAFAASLWHLDTLALQYQRFIERYRPAQPGLRRMSPEAAFVMRFAMVFDYLETAWLDPDLPPDLLPVTWPGAEARRLAKRTYEALLLRAIAFADSLPGARPR